MIRRFLSWNRDISGAIENRLPGDFRRSLLRKHQDIVSEYINRRGGQTLLDAGGGRHSPYAEACAPDRKPFVVALDVSEEELAANRNAKGRCAADLNYDLPLCDSSVDLVVTRSFIEHLEQNENFIKESYRVLKNGGCAIHVFPCKFSPFSIINQILPHKLSQKILYYFFPQWKHSSGFKSYYKNCYYNGITGIMKDNKFVIDHLELRYYQSIYYDFFVPLYIIMLAYDYLLYKANIKNLACQMIIVARKGDEAVDS